MEFKNLAEVTQLEEVPEGASVLAATAEGDIVRVLKDEVGFKLPEGGSAGQVLTMTDSGTEWADAPDPDLSQYATTDDLNSATASVEQALAGSFVTKEGLYAAFDGTLTLTWDGEPTDGMDSFPFNAWTFYKLSDLAPAFSTVTSGSCSRSSGIVSTTLTELNGCYKVGNDAYVVTSVENEMSAPSTGIYANKASAFYASEITIDCTVPQTGLCLYSSSGKLFAIKVGDDGTVSAVEV